MGGKRIVCSDGKYGVSEEELYHTCVDYFGEYAEEDWLEAFVAVRRSEHSSLWEFMDECRRLIMSSGQVVPFHSRYVVKTKKGE